MKNSSTKKLLHQGLRKAFSLFPRPVRFSIYRSFVDCDPSPDAQLVLKIAETKEELEACFKLLHDAYVSSGFMQPAASGMRVTIYHALPTTTTLCAKYDGEVVGTISLIRESVFGFPLQAIFDLNAVRAKKRQDRRGLCARGAPEVQENGRSDPAPADEVHRSEERRVGKEC